jgi:hypothetical protein
VGVIGSRPAAPVLLDALRRLEYRGYDSAGIATLVNGHIDRRRAEGKLGKLEAVLERAPLSGSTGIGHTRWATHGAPTGSDARHVARLHRAQRHHREPRGAARNAGSSRPGVHHRDRHGDRGPAHRPASAAGAWTR